MRLRSFTKYLIRKAGYEIHPASSSCLLKDAFTDQKFLLASSPVTTIFDVGANSGQTALKYRTLFPAAMIYSFEPCAAPLEEMRREFHRDPTIKPIQLAVSNVCGRKPFFINQSSFTNSLLPAVEKIGLYENIATTEVAVTTIDNFCVQEAVNAIDILKMDIQGGELLALEGAVNKLSRQEISLIYTEILFAPLYEEQAKFFKICDFLSGYGYSLFDMYNLSYQASGQLAWGDAIFVSPRINDRSRKTG